MILFCVMHLFIKTSGVTGAMWFHLVQQNTHFQNSHKLFSPQLNLKLKEPFLVEIIFHFFLK